MTEPNAPFDFGANLEKAYRKELSSHEWFYQYSDDPTAYRAGQKSNRTITAMRALIDPSGDIWNQFAPDEFKVKPIGG